jgi:hypothetical protein
MRGILRHEAWLIELPFDAGLPEDLTIHQKDDPSATREAGWEGYDLQRYLRLDEPSNGPMASTTLTFRSGSARESLFELAEDAWPGAFEHHRRQNDPWPLWKLRGQTFRRIHQFFRPLRARRTVVQATRISARPDVTDDLWRHGQLLLALEVLGAFLVASGLVHGEAEVAPVSHRELPLLIPGWGWDVPTYPGDEVDIDWWTYNVHDRGRPLIPLTTSETKLAVELWQARDHPLMPAAELLLAAQQSGHRGRRTHAVVEASTATELLVSGVLRSIGPTKGYDHTKLSNVLNGNFKPRVTDHFAPLLGYDRDPSTGNDALGEWWRHGYSLRNRVVHRGHRPSDDETAEAVATARALNFDAGDRLAQDASVAHVLLPIPAQTWNAAARNSPRRH